MDEKTAIVILLTFACCNSNDKCDKCPWNNTIDCKETAFDDVLDDAIDVVSRIKC